jgi:hypothetical protein
MGAFRDKEGYLLEVIYQRKFLISTPVLDLDLALPCGGFIGLFFLVD